MPYIDNSATNAGLYIATTTVYEAINSADISDDLKQLFIVVYQNVNNIAIALNQKQSGIYPLNEFVNGQGWFPLPSTGTMSTSQPLRPNFTKAYLVTSLPPGVTLVPHGIPLTSSYTFTLIDGVANDTVGFNYYPINSGDTTGIQAFANLTNIVITNNTAITFNVTNLVVEFLKQ